MYKAALIIGGLALFVATGATLLTPICVPCAAVFLGLGAGYLAGVFERPATTSGIMKAGAIGGALGGIGAIIGQVIGAALNGIMLGSQGLDNIYQQLHIQLPAGGPTSDQIYWFSLVVGTLCFSVLDVLLMAGFGALGGRIWWETLGKNAAPSSPTIMS